MEVQIGNRDAVVFRDAECRESLKLVRLLATLASWCRRRVLLRESLVWSSAVQNAERVSLFRDGDGDRGQGHEHTSMFDSGGNADVYRFGVRFSPRAAQVAQASCRMRMRNFENLKLRVA